ncbi:hypothetical protein D9613_009613 [Agrocybe pediades]|uniref:F-box domain-containing protein n=1 Tax=Agrocybe pediades TaxID=84607 RepID=A0A8H4R5I2_9AGAR|nr:hypothetical protein D9613_009613 [Agrocybe pediades]
MSFFNLYYRPLLQPGSYPTSSYLTQTPSEILFLHIFSDMETEEYPPKAHSVLCIPELLRLTFQLSDPASNAVNARVCKRWSEIALDCLWADVDDLLRLLKLLAPMTVVKGTRNVFDFQRSPQVHDWRRFQKYAKRVRRLTYDVKGLPSPRVIRFSAFDTLARTRLRLDFLPNLQSLTWIGPLNYSIIFMHDRISHFAISLSGEGPSLPLYFLDVVSRMPNLITLDIRSSIPMSKIQSEMTAMLGALTHLISVTFPPYYLTGDVVEALSLHPRLAEIEFDFAAILGFGDATRLIGLPHFPAANLTKLFLDSTSILAPDDIRSLLSVVMDNCQSLTGLSILSPRNLSPDDLASLDEGVCTTFHTIQPLLKLHGLTSFEFVQPFPLLLQQRDLEVIACSWPCMEILRLNSHPVTSHQTTSTLEGLIPFAEHCPNLTELDLFLDATRTDLPDPTVHFKALKFLDVGLSKIKDVDAVALYLCQILPEGCIVMSSGVVPRPGEGLSEELLAAIPKPCAMWGDMHFVLPPLIQLRIRERERSRLMEQELAVLRKMLDKKITETGGEASSRGVTDITMSE